jgi:hypothetical protein
VEEEMKPQYVKGEANAATMARDASRTSSEPVAVVWCGINADKSLVSPLSLLPKKKTTNILSVWAKGRMVQS